MDERRYSDQSIAAYLLGSLPAAESEKFDELSFTDDEFADRLKSAEKDLVDAYARGELTGKKLENFNSYYLTSPIRREKVEFAKAFQIFAEKNSAKTNGEIPAAETSERKRRSAGFFSFFNIFTTPKLQWGFAVAAVLFMLLGGWLLFENSQLRNQIGETKARRDELLRRELELQKQIERERSTNLETERELARIAEERKRLEQELEAEKAGRQQRLTEQAQETRQRLAEHQRAAEKQQPPARQISIVSFVLLPQLRGGNNLQTLSVPAETDSVAIRLELESNDYAAYRVALRNPVNNQILWRSGRVGAKSGGGNNSLKVMFPADLLKSQIYSLEVSGISAAGAIQIISDYSFKIVR